MNIVQIEYFMKVAEEQSFRSAAEKLYVTQPAISMQISLLEKEWQVELFVRKRHVVTLTRAGKMLYDFLKACDSGFQTTLKNAQLIEKGLSNELQIGVVEGSSLNRFFECVAAFQKDHPEILVSLEQKSLGELTYDIVNSNYDMILSHTSGLANTQQLEIMPLFDAKRVVIISSMHPVVKNNSLDIKDLDGLRIFVRGTITDSVSLEGTSSICVAHGLNKVNYTMMPNIQSIISSVQMGFGFAILDETAQIPDDGSVLSIPLEDEKIGIVLAWKRSNTNPYVSLLAERVKKILARS